jgi:release factor glutamine methyltransferase
VIDEVWTPLRLINWTKEYFEKRGIEAARLEAELLLAHALDCRRIDLYARFNEAVPPGKLALFRETVRRRASREPAQYILGRTEFCGLTFRTDRRALIPRPETEIVIDVTTELAKGLEAPLLVDVGTGSGILAVAAALKLRDATVVACDISQDALALARENAELHRVLDRVTFRHGDFAGTLADCSGRVDIAMANPPYVSEPELANLEPELREHEPRAALVAGPEGTEVQVRLLDFAPTLLRPGGHLVMEIGAGQAPRIRNLLAAAGQLELVRFEKDFSRIERVVLVRKKM